MTVFNLVHCFGGAAHIPTHNRVHLQRNVEPALYRRGDLVERFFRKVERIRHAARRFDKFATNVLANVSCPPITGDWQSGSSNFLDAKTHTQRHSLNVSASGSLNNSISYLPKVEDGNVGRSDDTLVNTGTPVPVRPTRVQHEVFVQF